MAQPFIDDFEGAGSTTALDSWSPSGGTAWTKLSGNSDACAVVTTGEMQTNNVSGDGAFACDDQGSADQYVEFGRGTDFGNSFVCCRLVDIDNFIGVRFVSGGTLQSFKRVASSFTQIGSNGSAASEGDTIRMECDGTAIAVYLNGSGTADISGTASDHATETTQGVVGRSTQLNGMCKDFEAGALGGGGKFQVLYRHRRAMQSLLAR